MKTENATPLSVEQIDKVIADTFGQVKATDRDMYIRLIRGAETELGLWPK